MPNIVQNFLANALAERPDDGLLHPSGDILSPIKHIYLRKAGVPTQPIPIANKLRMLHGTFWHKAFEDMMWDAEIRVDEGLPNGWAGTADGLTRGTTRGTEDTYRLHDLKTTSVWAFKYLKGIKDTHMWQVSAYYWALIEMGFDLEPEFDIHYIGTDGYTFAKSAPTEVLWETKSSKPLDRDIVFGRMAYRSEIFQSYNPDDPIPDDEPEFFLDEKTNTLKPHWLTKFCPYGPEYCKCGEYTKMEIEIEDAF